VRKRRAGAGGWMSLLRGHHGARVAGCADGCVSRGGIARRPGARRLYSRVRPARALGAADVDRAHPSAASVVRTAGSGRFRERSAAPRARSTVCTSDEERLLGRTGRPQAAARRRLRAAGRGRRATTGCARFRTATRSARRRSRRRARASGRGEPPLRAGRLTPGGLAICSRSGRASSRRPSPLRAARAVRSCSIGHLPGNRFQAAALDRADAVRARKISRAARPRARADPLRAVT
jgi:hypothetical protein